MLNYKFYENHNQNDTDQLLVMLHGFISDASTFDAHVERLRQEVAILTVELPGHGKDDSPFEAVWDFPYIQQELEHVLQQFKQFDITMHGYSMGGRTALYYALYGKVKLKRLILESASPGIEASAVRQERVQVDEARAKVLEIAGIKVFVNDWEKLPLFASQAEMISEAQRQRIRNMRLSQQPDRLAKALRDYGTGNMPNLWPELSRLAIPVCMIVGERDEKFCDIAEKMKKEIAHVEVHVVTGVGHTVHVEDVEQFDIIVLGFINKEEQND